MLGSSAAGALECYIYQRCYGYKKIVISENNNHSDDKEGFVFVYEVEVDGIVRVGTNGGEVFAIHTSVIKDVEGCGIVENNNHSGCKKVVNEAGGTYVVEG